MDYLALEDSMSIELINIMEEMFSKKDSAKEQAVMI